MTTPAGWYDDGSGRQRWWDGQQWTEHFAPEAAAPENAAPETAAPETAVPAVPEVQDEPSIDDTVIRQSEETVIVPEAQDWSAAPAAPASQDAPVYPAAAPAQPVAGYPDAAPVYPGAYASAPSAYPAAAPYGQAEAPKKPSVLGLVGLGLGVLGTILVFIPLVGVFGFVVLAAAFIVSLISLFLKGKKWPGITGLILSVVGTIIGIVMSFIFLFAFAQGVSEEIDNLPSSSPSIEATETEAPDNSGDTGIRPTAEEVAVGLAAIIGATPGADGYTDAQISCIAGVFVASDLDNETLRVIAESDGTITDIDAATGVAEVFGDTEAITACFVG